MITIDNLKVEKITSTPDVEKDMIRFMPYNDKTGIDVFNGTDDASGKLDGTAEFTRKTARCTSS